MSRIFSPAERQAVKGLLSTYQRTGDNKSWDTFREKIPDRILIVYGKMLTECRRNGFIGPRVKGGEWVKNDNGVLEFTGGKLVFWQVVSTDNRPGDLCTFCERSCSRRDNLDSGDMKTIKEMNKNNPNWHEPKACWESGVRP